MDSGAQLQSREPETGVTGKFACVSVVGAVGVVLTPMSAVNTSTHMMILAREAGSAKKTCRQRCPRRPSSVSVNGQSLQTDEDQCDVLRRCGCAELLSTYVLGTYVLLFGYLLSLHTTAPLDRREMALTVLI